VHPSILYHTPPTLFILYLSSSLLATFCVHVSSSSYDSMYPPPQMLYLSSSLLATFYTLSLIDYSTHLHQPTQLTIYIYIYIYINILNLQYIYIYIYIYILYTHRRRAKRSSGCYPKTIVSSTFAGTGLIWPGMCAPLLFNCSRFVSHTQRERETHKHKRTHTHTHWLRIGAPLTFNCCRCVCVSVCVCVCLCERT